MIWLFDYDLTLYGEEEHYVLDSLDKRISLFVQKTVGGTFENASKIRKDYLVRFGTTLAGLMVENNVKPDVFFDFIHKEEFLIYPKESKEKYELIKELPGIRYVFTNGRKDWCNAGLIHMKIESLFDGIFDLKQMDWVGKPNQSAYKKMEEFLLEKKQFFKKNEKKQIVLFEDSLCNLKIAHDMGWITVFVNPTIKSPEYVDFHISHLLDLKGIISKII